MATTRNRPLNDWEIWTSQKYWQLLVKKKPERETIASVAQSPDELTEGIEYDEELLSSFGIQGVLALQDLTHVAKDSVYDYRLEALIQEVKELKEIITQFTDRQPTVVCTKIYSLPSEQHELRAPIDVTLEIHPDEVLAIIPDLELYGEGSNQIEALNELKLEILDLYEDLEDMSDEELGNFPKSWKKTLQQFVKKCQ